MDDRLATTDMRQKWGGAAAPLSVEGAESPCNTSVACAEAYTSVPSGILIHKAVWPQYTNVIDRTGQDRQTTV